MSSIEVARHSLKAVVSIDAHTRKDGVAQSSGFLISEDGYIATNCHAVRDAHRLYVIFNDGQQYGARIIGMDPNSDLAVIKIQKNNCPYLTFADSDTLEIGQRVLAVGNPLGLKLSVTSGIVSAKGINNLRMLKNENFIQTDAPINMGSSGGPLIDLEGNVVGINTAIASNPQSQGFMGISFAIPSNQGKSVINRLLNNQR